MTLSRRGFLSATATGLVGASAVAAVDAFGVEAQRVGVTRRTVALAGLPAALDGFTVAHVTDVHLHGPAAVADDCRRAVAAARPDLVCVTGDAAEDVAVSSELTRFLAGLEARFGVVGVPGNWEYHGGFDAGTLRAAYAAAGARLLVNQAFTVDVGDAAVRVTGLDDAHGGQGPRLPGGRRPDPAVADLLLVHRPGVVDELPPGTAHVALAGHTHGGQVRLPGVPPVLPPGSGRFVSGWYADAQAAPLYVSRGVGTSGLRARFRCPAEVALVTLRAA